MNGDLYIPVLKEWHAGTYRGSHTIDNNNIIVSNNVYVSVLSKPFHLFFTPQIEHASHSPGSPFLQLCNTQLVCMNSFQTSGSLCVSTDGEWVWHLRPTMLLPHKHDTYTHMHTHIHIHIHTHTHIHTYIHTYIHTHMHTCTHTYIHTHMHIHTHIHIHTHTHIHTYTHAHIHTYTHAHMHTHIHTHIHTYTHIHAHTHHYIHMHTHVHTYTHIHTFIKANLCTHSHHTIYTGNPGVKWTVFKLVGQMLMATNIQASLPPYIPPEIINCADSTRQTQANISLSSSTPFTAGQYVLVASDLYGNRNVTFGIGIAGRMAF